MKESRYQVLESFHNQIKDVKFPKIVKLMKKLEKKNVTYEVILTELKSL